MDLSFGWQPIKIGSSMDPIKNGSVGNLVKSSISNKSSSKTATAM